MQLIVTSQITKEENLWIWSLCNRIKDTGTVERLVSEYGKNKTCPREKRARTEAKAEAIIELLEDYGEISGELQEKIFKETDMGVLKVWHKLAAKVDSIEEFKQAM